MTRDVTSATQPPGNVCAPLATTAFCPRFAGAHSPLVLSMPASDEVHVWVLPLNAPPLSWDEFHRALSLDEKERVARNRFPDQQRRFVARRGWLRLLLGSYLHTPPSHLCFSAESGGKPQLDPRHPLHFNISDSADCAVYAFAVNREVGVDVERVRHLPSAMSIVSRYFSQAECAMLEAWARLDPVNAFWFAWTFKEAHGKAAGIGITHRLEQILPHLPHQTPVAWGEWSARTWQPDSEHVATVVASGHDWVPISCISTTRAGLSGG